MPEAVASWSERQDAGEVDDILQEILFAYERDMGKHPDKNDVPKIHYLWNSVPSQLARENKKFLYSAAKQGARAREYENGLNWLVNADILKKVYAVTRPRLPIDAYDDLSAFKIYIGLLRKKVGVRREIFMDETGIFTEFKGAFTENYVLQGLLPGLSVTPRYWKDARHEVDFLVQWEGEIIPFEVKAGSSIKTTSMKRYAEQYRPRRMVRLSLKNLSFDGEVLNIPLFLLPGIITIGQITYSMTALPGTPQMNNIIPGQYFGTTMTAAPLLGIICSVAMFVPSYLYIMHAIKKAKE